ncbi:MULTISPECIES: HPP family protein [unclassified Parafrankia]|nr:MULTISPECIES: CBS domain-containing protein [unclassified Parafrankia]
MATRNSAAGRPEPAEAAGTAPAHAPSGTGPTQARVADVRAGEIMTTGVMVVAPDDDVILAWEVMAQAGVHHLPVVEGSRLVGMLDDRRLVSESVAGPLGPRLRTVSELLDREPPQVHADQTVRSVADFMASRHIDAVCVLDESDNLAGILTTADLVDALAGRRHPRRPGTEAALPNPMLFRLVPVFSAASPCPPEHGVG